MFVHFITYFPIPITSSVTILNSINSLFQPDTALVITSDNSLSIFHPLIPSSCSFPGGSCPKLSQGAIFTVYSHALLLFLLIKTPVSVKSSQLSYLSLSSGVLFIFSVRVSSFFSYFCVICTLVFFLFMWSLTTYPGRQDSRYEI